MDACRLTAGAVFFTLLTFSHISGCLSIVCSLFLTKSSKMHVHLSERPEDVMDEHVGQVIRRRRGELELTQEQLADRAGIAPTSVVRLENGEIERPRASTLIKLAGALGIPPGEFTRFVGTVHRGGAGFPDAGEELGSPGAPFTAVYQRDEDWWIGYVEELPGANAQEKTLEEARESLREAVSDVLEANRELTRTEFEGRDVVREPLGA